MSVREAIRHGAPTLVLMLAIALGVTTLPGESSSTHSVSVEPPVIVVNVERVSFPVEDCAAIAAGTTIGALGLVGGGYAATAAGASSLFFGTSAAAFHSAVAGVIWMIKDPAGNCVQHVGNSTSTAICNASHFSPWDPRGRAARTIVRFATQNEYSRC